MVTISIIGFGNVARHLAAAFENNPSIELVDIYSRAVPADAGSFSAKIVTDITQLAPADVYIISVSDAAVPQLSSQLAFNGRFVVHTAGSLAMDAIDGKNRRGVFYPLQTFSKNKAVDFVEVPLCIEAENPSDLQLLESVSSSLSNSVYRIDSEQRRSLHVSAVFASNFANHMYKIGSDICAEYGIPFDILKPLIRETASKIGVLSPREAQTGPAIRRDSATISSHLDLLTDENQKAIYQLLTQSIQRERKEL